jgi:hypothetical protein
MPIAAIVDYELTLSLPARTTADTGIDALTHAIEAYTSKKANLYSDTQALEAMRLIGPNLKKVYFDPNDEVFRSRFVSLADNILKNVQVGRGLTAYIIKADAELNTPDVVDRNEFRARIGIQPTRAAEFMFIEFSIHRTGSFVAGAETF